MPRLSLIQLPQRVSLAAQTAEVLRTAVARGIWKDNLPSERKLSEILRVSRLTIRGAAAILAKEKVLHLQQGRVHQIMDRNVSSNRTKSRFIGLVTEKVATYDLSQFQLLNEVRNQLSEHGFAPEIVPLRAGTQRERLSAIERYVNDHPACCWLLMSLGKGIQRWFMERKLPAIVGGSCYPSIKLPFLDVDYASVCRHAAGVFRRHHHSRLALILANTDAAGDQISEDAFRQGAAASKGTASVVVLRHDGTPENLRLRLDALFGSRNPPTALLVAFPRHAVITLLYLLEKGFRVPCDIALICRDHEPLFDQIIPIVSHYRFDVQLFANRLTRLMLKLIEEGLPPAGIFVQPRFFAGRTV